MNNEKQIKTKRYAEGIPLGKTKSGKHRIGQIFITVGENPWTPTNN
jgi:hypothetical protein